LFTEVHDFDDVGMMDERGDLSFIEEHLLEHGIVREHGEHGFDRHGFGESAGAFEASGPYGGHTAFRDGDEEFESPNGCPGADVIEGIHEGSGSKQTPKGLALTQGGRHSFFRFGRRFRWYASALSMYFHLVLSGRRCLVMGKQ